MSSTFLAAAAGRHADAIVDATAAALLATARATLISTRSNETYGQRPGEMPEATLDGERATELVCWTFVRGISPLMIGQYMCMDIQQVVHLSIQRCSE